MTSDHPPICNYENSDYQTAFWEHGGRAYEDQVEDAALRRLLPTSGKLLLEVGAGAGRNTPRYHFERIILLDYSRTQLQQAQARLGRGDRYCFVAADAYRLPFVPDLFDAVTCIRTLHHMADAPRVLRQVRQVIQVGGIFILEFANKQNLKAILRYLLRRQHWNPFTLEAVEFAPLNFDFHPKAIRSWLKESNFIVEQQLAVSHFRLEWIKRWLPLKLLVWLDTLMQPTGNSWQFTPSVFIRARAAGQNAILPPQDGALPHEKIGQHALSSYFRCPACTHFPLDEAENALLCPACGRQWPIWDRIYDFRQ
jgi:ubiquinone/menaquinone biosynthesis C-methylase UbiE